MTMVERIRDLCKKNSISITTLEESLGFSNGSLTKSAKMASDRVVKIAEYFGVTTDYILTGNNLNFPVPEYNPEHIELISTYSSLSSDEQKAIMTIIRSMRKAQ